MAQNFAKNFSEALEERTDDLAKAGDAQTVQTIVKDAEAEALSRTIIPDTKVYRITVGVLGLSVLLVIVAQLWITLVKDQTNIPDGLIAIGSAAIGALAGLLAPTPAN